MGQYLAEWSNDIGCVIRCLRKYFENCFVVVEKFQAAEFVKKVITRHLMLAKGSELDLQCAKIFEGLFRSGKKS